MDRDIWYLILLGIAYVIGQVLKTAEKKKKRAKAAMQTGTTEASGSEVVESVGDKPRETPEPRGDAKRKGVFEHLREDSDDFGKEEDADGDLVSLLVNSIHRIKSEREEQRSVSEAAALETVPASAGVGTQSGSSVNSEITEAVQEGISHMGYEAGGGVITDLSYPLGTAPAQEGGEGLAAQKAAELRAKAEEKLRSAREVPLSIGASVLQDARRAMVATFILEPKFKRSGGYNR